MAAYENHSRKGHVTRGKFSCKLQRNDDDWKTLQVSEGVSHVRNIFFATCDAPAGNCRQLFLRPPAWNLPQPKDALWLAHFHKIALQVAIDMSHAATYLTTLWKVEDSSTFLATRNATFCCIAGSRTGWKRPALSFLRPEGVHLQELPLYLVNKPDFTLLAKPGPNGQERSALVS